MTCSRALTVVAGQLPAGLPLDYADLLSVQVAQPKQDDGVNRIVFSLNVADLKMLPSLPPSAAYFISFKAPDKKYRGVRMVTDQMGKPTFLSYEVDPGGLNGPGAADGRFVVAGSEKPADAASNTSGTSITIVVPAENVGVRKDGDELTEFNAAMVQSAATPAVTFADTFDQIPDDLSREGGITLDQTQCGGKSALLAARGAAPAKFGGALGLGLLLPLFAGALRRRRLR